MRASEAYDDAGFNSFFRRGWKRFHPKWYGDPPPSARAACPRTVELLESIPEVRAALFAYPVKFALLAGLRVLFLW